MVGAKRVVFNDIDTWSCYACELNADVNGFSNIETSSTDYLTASHTAGEIETADFVLAGDVFYEQGLGEEAYRWLSKVEASGVDVLLGDPGRYFLPQDKLACIASYSLPQMLRDANYGILEGHVWRLTEAQSSA